MLVCTAGKCKCSSATQCGVSTECLTFECLNEACTSTIKAKGELVDGKDPGDCLKNVCDGDGTKQFEAIWQYLLEVWNITPP